MEILIVEDARDQRLILSSVLKKQGHYVHLAENGKEALALLEHNASIQLVISDWMMPEMDGPELCKKIRTNNFSRYIYFLLLTGKSEDDAVVQGMSVGADDFLRKPVNFKELEARLKAGFRVLALEQRLAEKNCEVKTALQTVETDLQSAGNTLLSLLPAPCQVHQSLFDWRFQPSKILGGDMLGYQALDDEHIAFYQIDVSGHGVPSALFSFSLNHLLSDINPHSSLLMKEELLAPFYSICVPEEVVKALNARFQSSASNMMYFTMVYGVLHSPTGKVRLTHAGHPASLHISLSGDVVPVAGAGAPIGMVPDFPYESQEITLKAGEALFCYTDGVTESMNKNQEVFGEARLQQVLHHQHQASSEKLLNQVMGNIIAWQGEPVFDDDISYMLLKQMSTPADI